jgi:peptidoglycan/xylan/chitin deacetylase (PgdA/CDA1 family)
VPDWVVSRRLPAGTGKVLLTFDDGPHPAHTPAVFDRLGEYRAAAAFFVVGGRIGRAPGVIARAVGLGYAVGNHSFAHRPVGPFAVAAAVADVAAGRAAIRAAGGPAAGGWYRPPYGRITPAVALAGWANGYRLMGWSLDSNDWMCRTPAEAAACGAATAAAARPGDIVLLHDSHALVLPLLDALLPGLRKRGLV